MTPVQGDVLSMWAYQTTGTYMEPLPRPALAMWGAVLRLYECREKELCIFVCGLPTAHQDWVAEWLAEGHETKCYPT